MADGNLNWFHFLILMAGPLVILIGCIIFSLTFLDDNYKHVFVSSLFSRTARLWNSLLAECFFLIYDLNGFRSRVMGFFYLWFLSNQLSISISCMSSLFS